MESYASKRAMPAQDARAYDFHRTRHWHTLSTVLHLTPPDASILEPKISWETYSALITRARRTTPSPLASPLNLQQSSPELVELACKRHAQEFRTIAAFKA
jgi:hypothetical protein